MFNKKQQKSNYGIGDFYAGIYDLFHKYEDDSTVYGKEIISFLQGRIVKGRNMEHYFKGIYGAPVKKHEHITNVMENNCFLPNEVIMIGDALADYDAANLTGTHFIGRKLPNEASPFPEGTKLINDLDELAQCLKSF